MQCFMIIVGVHHYSRDSSDNGSKISAAEIPVRFVKLPVLPLLLVDPALLISIMSNVMPI